MRTFLKVVLLLLSLVLTGGIEAGITRTHADTTPELFDRIVAVVNGEVITLTELKQAKARLRLNFEYPDFIKSNSRRNSSRAGQEDHEVLNQLIERKLQVQLAQKRGINISDRETQQMLMEIRAGNGLLDDEIYRETLRKEQLTPAQYEQDAREQLMILKLASREAKEGILLSEDDLIEYYEKHREEYRLPDGFLLKQILILVPEADQHEDMMAKAESVVLRLRSGTDFNEMVQKYSQGPEARDNGVIGFIQIGQMLAEVESAVSDLPPGGISEPVITTAGIHIFGVDEVRRGKYLSFEEVKSRVREQLFQERVVHRYRAWLHDIRKAAQVEIRL